jgi:hypothetical protein
MKIKTITKTFIFPLAMMILVFASCKQLGLSKDDNKDKEKLALGLILLSQSGKEVIPAAAVANASVSAAMKVARDRGRSDSVFNKEYTKDFLLAYAKDKLNAKFPYLKLTAIDAGDATCTIEDVNTFNCDATLNGTDNCQLGGSVTFTNVRVKMSGTAPLDIGPGGNFPINFSSTIDGNISYDNCKTKVDANYDFIEDDEVTMNGSSNVNIKQSMTGTGVITITLNDTAFEVSSNKDYTVTENSTVNVRDFSVNGQNIGNQDYQVDVDIRIIGSQTPVNSVIDPPILTSTFTIDNTLNGYVKINRQTVKEFNNTNIRRTCTSSANLNTGESSLNCN